ncbi:hypothetical protein [Mesorhizobium sp. L-8-3]|uniref:hypothetical protein n=1 Tax=Mesorhizobium sp. L-8-3 TaxID=2744522 RepID=UPI001928F45B|nr:hypothetical protein [Mesorhizobium sp. L-8-3]BCH22606.1 hypothetical protein MesoLjLb_23910 [Mesorhizobium sp. L-8-3]
MKANKGAAVLSALLYAQGLLGIAAVAAVLLKSPADAGHAGSGIGAVQVASHQQAR